MDRKDYVEALKREKGFVEQTTPDDARRLADIDAELSRLGSAPVRRGRPETA